MSSTNRSYEIVLSIDGKSHQDVNYFCFFRMPVLKQASYCITKSYLPQVIIKSLMQSVNYGIFPKIGVKIYTNHQERNRQNSKLIYDQLLSCINCTTNEEIKYDQEKAHASLLLVHPIIRFLGNTNTYNQIHRDMTAYDILKDFENYLTSNHGNIFTFNHIGDSIEKNEYVYENVLVKSKDDLNVPSYLIHNYKINNSFSFYFFDNFNIGEKFKKEINCHYINVYDKNQFSNIDVEKWVDTSHFPVFQKEIHFTDYFQQFDKKGHRPILVQQDIRYNHEKKPEEATVPKKDPSGETESVLSEDRIIKIENNGTESEKEFPTSTTFSRIYCPDNVENGNLRFEIGKDLIKNKIDSLDLYEFSECLPDFPQFGNIYNLYEGGVIDDFISTPLNIINIFKRKNMKEQFLYHFTKVLFMRYTGE
ncbi:MAG: hypothetical protein ACOC1O_02075 [bacterium]